MISESTFSGQADANVPECNHGGIASAAATREVRRHRAVPIVAALALSAAGAYVLYQRIGTIAQANVVEFTPNLAGGFLAIGMTEENPGFAVLSTLDREAVDVRADHYANVFAGDLTVAEVRTPQTTWHRRLRGPVVVMVDEKGVTEEYAVNWSVADFALIREGADCGHADHGRRHRCGAPFANLFDIIVDGQLSRVPPEVRRFLASHARPRDDHTNRGQSNASARAASAGLDGGYRADAHQHE